MADTDPYAAFAQNFAAEAPVTAPAPAASASPDAFGSFMSAFGSETAPSTHLDPEKVARAAAIGDILAKPVAALAEDEHFDPVSAFKQFGDDPEARKKIVDAYIAKKKAGFDFGKFLSAIPEGAAGAVKGIATGAGDVAANAINYGEATLQGDNARGASAAGELLAAPETALANLAGILRRASRAIGLKGKLDSQEAGEKAIKEEQDIRDVSARAASGEGDISKALFSAVGEKSLKDYVEKHGGDLDPQTIQEQSAVEDPTLFIPGTAAAKAAGKAGLVENIALKAIKGGKDLSALALEKGGAAAVKLGSAIDTTKGGLAGAVLEAAAGGVGFPTGGIIAGAAAPTVLKKGGEIAGQVAGKLRGTVPPGPIWRGVAGTLDSEGVKGAARGALAGVGATGDPLAGAFTALNIAGAENEEQAGASLGGQAAVGAGVGALHGAGGALKPYFDLPAKVFDQTAGPAKPTTSAAYGDIPELDQVHSTEIAKLPQGAQDTINSFRELFRNLGTKLYVLDPENFGRGIAELQQQKAEARGQTLSPEQLSDIATHARDQKGVLTENFDAGNGKERIVFLNSDGSALQHEGGELFFSLLDPEAQKNLMDVTRKAYGKDGIAKNKADYENAFGQSISEPDAVRETIAENISGVLNAVPVEKLGTPKPAARAIYQGLGSFLEKLGVNLAGDRETPLGFTPNATLQNIAENVVRAQVADAAPQLGEVKKVDLSKVDIGARGQAPDVAIRTANEPIAPRDANASSVPTDTNIRVTREDQNRFQKPVESVPESKNLDAIAAAVDRNKAYGPEQKAAFVKLGGVIAQGGRSPTPIEIDYNSANSKEFNAGRTDRRREQGEAYVAEALGALPERVRSQVQKVLIPDRLEVRSEDNVQVVAHSLDKIIGNAYKLTEDAAANKVGQLIPYDRKGGALTDTGWTDLVSDIQDYTKNQANGYAGNGKRIVKPSNYSGVIPEPNPGYTPLRLDDNKAQFINTLMALPPPKTTGTQSKTASGVPANINARRLAEGNQGAVLPSRTSNPNKSFYDDYGVEIAEFNPLRDKLAAAGVKVRDLNEVTERVNLANIKGVRTRNDLDFSRPSTDLIRAGFSPDAKKAPRVGNDEVRDIAASYAEKAGIPYKPFSGYAKIPEELGKRIADFFNEAQTAPNDPAVRAHYDALGKETLAQYQDMVGAGYSIEPWSGKGEPYKSSSDMVSDVKNNKHLWFFLTDNGFGSDGKALTAAENPLLAPAGVEINGKQLVLNDVFRAVHDFYGHAKEGYEFGPRGEYNAFLAHSSMFTPEALPALAAETLAQNAWVNFGPHLRREDGSLPVKGDTDFKPLVERPFADQKVLAVPDDLLQEALAGKTESAAPDAKFSPAAKDEVEDPRDTRSYKQIAKNLTPEERAGIRANVAQQIVDLHKVLPKDEDFETAYKLGSIKKGWYERAAKSIQTIFGPDSEKFVGVLAATSPRQSVQLNLEMAFDIWNAWDKAGRPEDADTVRKLVKPLVVLEARENNTVRALTGQDLEDNPINNSKKLDDKTQLSGHKVESFRRNLLGDLNASTNDSWMAQFSNIDQGKYFGSKSGYLAFNAKVRGVATKLGVEPAHVQETVWSFFKTLVEATTSKRPAKEVLDNLSEKDVALTPEFHDELINNPQIHAQLERLGFTGFDRLGDPEQTARVAGASDRPLTSTNLGEGDNSKVLGRLAKRAQGIKDAEIAAMVKDKTSGETSDSADSPDPVLAPHQKEELDALPFSPKQKKPLPEAVGGELSAIHFSGAGGLKAVDPRYLGKGRATAGDQRGLPVSFFFQEGSKPQGDFNLTMGRAVYGAKIDGNSIYDLNSDPLDYLSVINREKADQMLVDAGYRGFAATSYGRKVIVMYEKTPVKYLGQSPVKGMQRVGPPKIHAASKKDLTDMPIRSRK